MGNRFGYSRTAKPSAGRRQQYNVTTDGRRFLTVNVVNLAHPPLGVVYNWQEEFRGGEQEWLADRDMTPAHLWHRKRRLVT